MPRFSVQNSTGNVLYDEFRTRNLQRLYTFLLFLHF